MSLLAVPFIGLGTASAEPGETELVLAVYQGGTVETARLGCSPAEGEHDRANQACAQIAAADGDFARLSGESDQQVCTFIYDPVTVAAFGTWRGEPVRYTQEFPNRCVMESETGAVFEF
ncbi:SSI family serine proteinase inhibitor [Actinokineospora sp. 24-640]